MTGINRSPEGFLGFLGVKNFGRNPEKAADVLSPTWDLSDLYLAGSHRFATTFHTVTTLGLLYTSFTVPANQVWHVHNYGMWANQLFTTSVLGMVPVVFFSAQSIYIPLQQPSGPWAVGTAPAVGIERSLILSSGESIGFIATHHAAPNPSVTSTICYTMLEA